MNLEEIQSLKDKTLDSLFDLAPELSALERKLDEISSYIKETEFALKKIPIPDSVSIKYKKGCTLGLLKWEKQGRNRIVFGEKGDIKPLVECRAQVRLDYYQDIPKLIDILKQKIKERDKQ